MSAPGLIEQFAALAKAQKEIDELLATLESQAPDLLKPLVATLKGTIDAALLPLDLPGVVSSLLKAGEVIKAGKGESSGGADASLA